MSIKFKLIAALIPLALISANVNANTTENSAAGAEATSTPGQFIDDSAITLKVKSSFIADSDIKSLGISVSTDNGVVRLTGTVENEMQKQKAVDIAKKVNGVKSVVDELVIKKPE